MFGAVYTLRPTCCFFFELLVINKTRMISLLRSATVDQFDPSDTSVVFLMFERGVRKLMIFRLM
jgi:hypothetical protein